jgi:hypothetical protein
MKPTDFKKGSPISRKAILGVTPKSCQLNNLRQIVALFSLREGSAQGQEFDYAVTSTDIAPCFLRVGVILTSMS